MANRLETKTLLITTETQNEIDKNANELEKMQNDINVRLADELKDVPNANKEKMMLDIEKIITKQSISMAGSLELNRDKKVRAELLETFDESVAIEFTPFDFESQFLNFADQQKNILRQSASATYDQYVNLYNDEVTENIFSPSPTLKFDTIEELEEIATELAQQKMNGKFLVDDEVTYFLRTDGKRERVQYWYERNVKATITNQADENRRQQMAEFGANLVRVSAHADCSPLCSPWQGRIYWELVEDPDYPSLDEAISGGLRHPNCRHNIEPYNRKFSTPTKQLYGDVLPPAVPIKEQRENYAKRQQGNSYKRTAVQYNDRYLRAKQMGEDKLARKYRNKRIEFNKRAKELGVNI